MIITNPLAISPNQNVLEETLPYSYKYAEYIGAKLVRRYPYEDMPVTQTKIHLAPYSFIVHIVNITFMFIQSQGLLVILYPFQFTYSGFETRGANVP